MFPSFSDFICIALSAKITRQVKLNIFHSR
jgi:hypothetical protein